MLRKSVGRSWKVAAAFVAATAFIAPAMPVVAQIQVTGGAVPGTPQTGVEWIKVRNVRAGLMAWLIDAAHNPEPSEVKAARFAEGGKALSAADLFDMPEDFQLPPGIVSVTAIDAQNTLSVVGNPQSVAQLKAIVESLDKPIQYVEVDARFITLNPEELKQLGLTPSKEETPKIQAGFVTAEFQQRIDSLVEQGKARIVNAPRATFMNRFSGRLGSRQTVPVELKVDPSLKELQQQLDTLPRVHSWSKLVVGQDCYLRVKPTYLDGNKVLLSLTAVKSLLASEQRNIGNPLSRFDLNDLPSVELKTLEDSRTWNMEDGQTVVISGLLSHWMEDATADMY